jgi:sporulation protein YpjB
MFDRGMRRLALALLGAATFFAVSGCGSDERLAHTEQIREITEEQRQIMQRMDEAAEEAYQSVQGGDLEKTRETIARLSVLAARLPYEGITNVEGIQAISGAVAESMRLLHAVTPDEAQIAKQVIRTRLAVDALSHRQQPMWLGFYRSLSNDLAGLETAVRARDQQAAADAFEQWKARVALIQPAIIISRDASEVMKLESISAFLDRSIREADWSALDQALPDIRQAIEELFQDPNRETLSPLMPSAEPPHPIIWSLVFGAVITAVLAYVAWRKYEGSQGVSKVKQEKDISRI